MILLSILFILLLVLFVILLYALYNILTKYEKLEDEFNDLDEYISKIYNDLQTTYTKLSKIDRLGSFEADDETGFIFNQIKKSIESMNDKYNLDGKKTKE